MIKVYLKYNPFKLETIVLIDGESVKENSILNVGSKRLQEWIFQLPQYLNDECNENEFELEFMGTKMDFEDIEDVVKQAELKGIYIQVSHIPVLELDHMEKRIEEVFNEIVEGPIDELKSNDLKASFQQALNDEFEVTVVATMSAGKSTLINALLQQKIMPSSQEACTATISRIKDTNDSKFKAIPHSVLGDQLEVVEEVTLEKMNQMNNDEKISVIELHGNIPFTDSKETSLVLIDTPGPNNSRDENHLKTTYKNLSESSKTLVLYILNATQLGVNDDSELLNKVSESMKVGGKQSKDRYLFVVNKLDQFRKGEDNVESSLAKVRKYLASRGIIDPHIFPSTASVALGIRQLLNHPENTDEELIDEINLAVRKLNRNKELHLEKYTTLTPSTRQKIENELEAISKKDIYSKETALIHTGIPSIEHMIKLYVDKYARTAKVKNVVDTFQKKLESSLAFENMKNTISNQKSQHEKIYQQINELTQKIQAGNESKIFEEKIKSINPMEAIKKEASELLKKQGSKLADSFAGKMNEKFSIKEANDILKEMKQTLKESYAELNVKLEIVIERDLNKAAHDLLEQYHEKIKGIVEGMEVDSFVPYELISGELDMDYFSIEEKIKKEKVKVGTETYSNPDREGFWGFFKFFTPKTISKDVLEERAYINGQELIEDFLGEVESRTRQTISEMCNDAEASVVSIKSIYNKKFREVDRILVRKLKELKDFTGDAEKMKSLIEKSNRNLMWLKEIDKKIKGIIELESIKNEEASHVDYTIV